MKNKYLKILSRTFSNSISEFFMYRADFFFRIFMGLLWSTTSLVIVELIFYHTPSLDGWSQSDILLLYITLNLAFVVQDVLTNSIFELSSHIAEGRFDFIIIKPIDSQFFAMFNRPDPGALLFFFTYNIPLIYGLYLHSDSPIHWLYFPLYILLILASNILWMLMRTIIMTLNFWWQRLDNIGQILNSMQEIGRYPISIYPRPLKIIFYTIFPIAFSGVVPAEVLRGNISWVSLIGMFIVLCILSLFSRFLWKKAIRNYTSASS